ncbi:hypothetical protein MTR_8g016400 [Medicago truncatula]|uniref:Zinc finger C3HC4 RING-type domain-containing protein n=1 Tax=Medicago truncatula TaxID=3880 RepID=G7ZVG1_MEDTR|nr:hypothetical protein MTR_8g016400 [Medicago truncatula]
MQMKKPFFPRIIYIIHYVLNIKIWLCSHTFHFPCISTHVTKQPLHVCPVCGTNWKELPVLSIKLEKNENRD